MVLGCAKEGGRFRVSGAKIVSDWRQHSNEVVASVRQRKNGELVKDVLSPGDGGEKPVEVVLVDALREKGDHSEKVPGVGAEFAECGGSER